MKFLMDLWSSEGLGSGEFEDESEGSGFRSWV